MRMETDNIMTTEHDFPPGSWGSEMAKLEAQLDEIEPGIREACLLTGDEEACDAYQRILSMRSQASEARLRMRLSIVDVLERTAS